MSALEHDPSDAVSSATAAIRAASAAPSASQRRAIEAPPTSLLVKAGPGAGKTFCLTERIRFLIEHHGFDPKRICVFTFTNKAAGEIADRLTSQLGAHAGHITRGTLHAFCAERLREFPTEAGLVQGFGIADEEYQLSVLRRIEGARKWHRSVLTRFSAYRFRRDVLQKDDMELYAQYERFLHVRNLVDFDQLVIKAALLLESSSAAEQIRARWDVVLVDEFQDLNPVQYRVAHALAQSHRHVFAVGDDEQSIYSWAGADPKVFRTFLNDFGMTSQVRLEENWRCPQNVFALARRLIETNTPLFDDRSTTRAARTSPFPVRTLRFPTDDAEATWIVEDIRRDRIMHEHAWGAVAVLYRTHAIGDRLETAFLNVGVPCRLAVGRAIADDRVVRHVIAATRVIASPRDDLFREAFYQEVLPRPLFNEASAKAAEGGRTLARQLSRMAARLPRADDSARQIRRALADSRNLEAVGQQHRTLSSLVQDLLSRKVGVTRSALDDHHDEIGDPAALPDVVALFAQLQHARSARQPFWIPPMGGAEIALVGMLRALGVVAEHGGAPSAQAIQFRPAQITSVDAPLGVFKAAQLLEMSESEAAFTNFTAVDLETTDNDVAHAEIVEIAAVRVREGNIVAEFVRLVKPRVAIAPGAVATHGISEAELADEPHFEAVWPAFRDFLGDDVIVAHNGYDFDFPILRRMAKAMGSTFDVTTFDTLPLARDLFPTSRKLSALATRFGIETGQSHRALDDTRALAKITVALGDVKLQRARKTALVYQLGHLGVALALCDENTLSPEGALFRKLTTPFVLGKFGDALDWYEAERGDDHRLPSVDDVIEACGGVALMEKIRATKTADQRYPQAMLRLRRLIADLPSGTLHEQLSAFLERVVLSKWQGVESAKERVNLLTLHSTKGLEFSRVYIVGVEDRQMPGGSETKGPTPHEIEESRRLLYVGMTRTQDRLTLTAVDARGGKPTGGTKFLDEMLLTPESVP